MNMMLRLHEMDVMDRELGHRTVTWDPANPEAVEDARRQFDALKAQGYSMFSMIALGQHAVTEEQGEEMEDFDPHAGRVMVRMDEFNETAERVTAIPQRQGG
jgi:hypothetical protein